MSISSNWTGSADASDYTNLGNWDNGVPENAGDTAVFSGATVNLVNVPNAAIIFNAVGDSNAVNLGGATIHHSATFTGTVSAFSNFTWLSPNAGASRTQSSVTVGGTFSGTYNETIGIPTSVGFGNAEFDGGDGFVAGSGTWSIPVSATAQTGSNSSRLTFPNSVFINMPDVTVTAAASSPKQNRLSLSIGMGL